MYKYPLTAWLNRLHEACALHGSPPPACIARHPSVDAGCSLPAMQERIVRFERAFEQTSCTRTQQGNQVYHCHAVLPQVNYNGLTPLGSQLDAKVIRPFVAGPVQSRTLQKPVLVRSTMRSLFRYRGRAHMQHPTSAA